MTKGGDDVGNNLQAKLAGWQSAILGQVGMVAMLNAAVAVFAFIKDVLMASYFGTSIQADAFNLAYFIPDMLGCNLIAASLGVSCVPVFSKLSAIGQSERMWQTLRSVLVISVTAGFLLMIALYGLSPQLSSLIANNPTLSAAMLPLLRIMMPLILLGPLLFIGFAMLQTIGDFTRPAGLWLVLHIFVIVVIAISLWFHLPPARSVYGLSVAITLGILAMSALMWKQAVSKGGFRWKREAIDWRSPELRDIGSAFAAYLLILFCTQAIYFIERMLASQSDVGSITGLNYAFRLSQLPFTVFVLAISNVVLPSMAQDIALNKQNNLQRTIIKALTDILIISIPTSLLLYVLRVPIVSVLFQRGAFDEHSVRITTEMLKGYSLTIVGLSVSAICLRYFLAARKVRIVMLACMISALINVAADVYLNGAIGAKGLGYGAFLGALVNGALLMFMVVRDLRLPLRLLCKCLPKIAIANLPPLVIGVIGGYVWFDGVADASFVLRTGYLFVCLGLAAVIYWFCLRKLNLIQF